MAYSLIASAKVTSPSLTTSAINTSGADLIVVCAAFGVSGTVSDNKGNTWTQIGSNLSNGPNLGCYYCQAPTVGSGHTFNYSGGYASFFVAAFSGSIATPLDQTIGATGTPATTFSAGSITPTQGNELVVAFLATDTTSTNPTIGSSYNLTGSQNGISGTVVGGGLGYIIQSGASATNPAWSWSGAASCCALIASFKTATVAPTGQPMLVRFGGLSLRDALMAGAAAAIVKNPSLSRRGLFGRPRKLGLRSN